MHWLESCQAHQRFKGVRLYGLAPSFFWVRPSVMFSRRGYSMEPTIHAGDAVLIDTEWKRVHDGYIYTIG